MLSLLWSSVNFFWVAQSFVGLLPNYSVQIKGIAICGVRRPDVKNDVVTEIFSLSRLGFSVCVTRHKILLLDVGSSCSHPLVPEQHCFLQVFHVGLVEAVREDEWKYNVTISSDHPSILMWTGCLVFINMNINLSSDKLTSNILKYSY